MTGAWDHSYGTGLETKMRDKGVARDHKDLAQYIGSLRRYRLKGDVDACISILKVIVGISNHALKKLEGDNRDSYFNDVF